MGGEGLAEGEECGGESRDGHQIEAADKGMKNEILVVEADVMAPKTPSGIAGIEVVAEG